MGCGSSKSADVYIEPIDVPDTEAGYPPPRPTRDRKEKVFREGDCETLDANAKKLNTVRFEYTKGLSITSTYSTLVDHVTQGARNDIEKVRSLFAWLGAQRIHDMTFANVKDAHNPEGYMKTIQQGNGSYTSFFALLCRAAGIPCVVVRGVGKSASYEVGQQDVSQLTSSWNAVYVDGQWRLVHVFWALVGVEGFNKGGWTKVEQGGKAVRQKEQANKGKQVYMFEEFWFLTNPDEFIYLCRAKNTDWQLLKSPWTMDKFVNVPHFTMNYFESGLKLVSQHAAILKCKKVCDVNFEHSESLKADLDYALFYDEQNSKDSLSKDLQLERFVVEVVDQKHKGLHVRFPARGIYKLKVTGVTHFKALIASFRLESDSVMENAQPYPINPPIGFGFGQKAEEMGLSKPSQVKGIMVVRQGERIKFHFQCKQKLDIQSMLVHKDQSASELDQYVTRDQSGDEVTITVNVPEHAQNPEYALQVNVRPEGSKGGFENVVNYLLTHGKDLAENQQPTFRGEPGPSDDDEIRMRLIAATESRDIDRLEKAIREFEKAGLPDLGDLTRARKTLIALHEQALKDAVQERDLDMLETAIQRANESCVVHHLQDGEALSEAEALRSLLRRLKLYLHKILELKPMTVSEIHSYKRPRPRVHTVMKATYLLLGEKEKQLNQWEYIQSLLRRQGRESIIRRIKEFDLVGLKVSSMHRAESHLQSCNKELVRQTSAGAGTFYIWSRNIINEGKKALQDDNQQT
ncbi:hypothetical protein BaRGS_00011924 [Batillaria attramentaria]|uniref:Transglutaminase-like domain-containing protein n=1 Tax=Batillaria attramentaria TaxID=370345 RepID=A0ABD0LD85_9CAEN